MIHLLTIKLDASNYMMWRKQVQHLLRSQRLLGHIDGSNPCPRVPPPPSFAQAAGSTTPAGSSKAVYEERKTAYKQWIIDDEKLCCLLLSSVSVEVMSEISSCDTAAQIWDTLASVFHNRSKSSVLNLRVQIMNLCKTGSVHELHLQFKALFDKLAAMDAPAINDDMVLWFLHALGAELRDFSAPLLSRSPTPAYVDVVAEAENQEAFLKNLQGFGASQTAPVAFLAEGNFSGPGGGAWSHAPACGGGAWGSRAGRNGRGGGRGCAGGRGNFSGGQGGADSSRSAVECRFCRKLGHTAQTCYKLFPPRRGDAAARDESALLAQQFQSSLTMEPSHTASDWYIDSGATNHLTSSASALESVTPYSGPVEMAAVGISVAIFNQVSKVAIFPIVNITTSFVAEEDTVKRLAVELEKSTDLEKACAKISEAEEMGTEQTAEGNMNAPSPKSKMEDFEDSGNSPAADGNVKCDRRQIPSVSTALAVGAVLGLLQTLMLMLLAKPVLGFMGVKPGSPMLAPAQKYLTLRALGSPAVALSLAMQGVFRGFKDTTTPLYATVAGDTMNILLDGIFIFVCHLGVSGAAMAHVLSQYLISIILLCKLMQQVTLLPPSAKHMQFTKFLKSGSLILARVLAATICVTLGASMAARLGTTPMAAFQVCLQVWLTSSLLSDGLAVAGQAILACAFAEKDYEKATAAARRVIQMGFVLGLSLLLVVGVCLYLGSGIFSKDKHVLLMISVGVPFVAGTQPINSLAFVFDGINYGSFDFAYSAYSMVMVAAASIGCLFLLSKSYGFIGIWIALSIYMILRAFAGFWRVCSGTGPWSYLRGRSSSEDTISEVA